MTENEAIKEIKRWTEILLSAGSQCTMETAEAQDMAIKALEEVQQYRALGTLEELQIMKEHGGFTGVELAQIAIGQMKLKEYQAIGTPEECRAAMTVKKEVQEIVDRQLVAGKNNYKETYDCFWEIVKVVQANY